jgi:hypothetical protein
MLTMSGAMPAVAEPMQRNESDKQSDPEPITCKPFHVRAPVSKR